MPVLPLKGSPVSGTQRRKPRPFSRILAGRAWWRGKIQPVELGLGDDGRIAQVARSLVGAPRHDLGEMLMLPAATDLHVHFRDPGGPEPPESFATGTLQAALGGVGVVADMPNTNPPVRDVAALRAKEERAQGRLAVDLMLYAGVERPAAIPSLGRLASAFKLFLSPTTGATEPPDQPTLRETMDRVSVTGLPLHVHAEDPAHFSSEGEPGSTRDWDAHRPAAAEEAGVARLLPPPPALRLHVAHVSSARALALLLGGPHSFEVTPHHLLLSTRQVSDARGKVNPPLRSEAERAALWAAFCRGEIPCLASDHAPHSAAMKERAFSAAPSGMPGVETMLPLLLAEARSSELALATLLSAACDRPARWLGIPAGRVEVGYRANLVAVDFRARTVLHGDRLHAPCGWTAFEGWEGIFPREHYLDGVRIVEGGEYVGSAVGRVIRPEVPPLLRAGAMP